MIKAPFRADAAAARRLGELAGGVGDAIPADVAELVALGAEPGDVVEGWLARLPGASVDPAPRFAAVLRAVAPDASAAVVDWRVAGAATTA